jgi:hypothetical protein
MADSRLYVVIGAKTTELERNLKGVKREMRTVGIAAAAMGAAISAAIFVSVKEFAQTGAAIYDMSKKTGYSAEMLSELSYAAEQTGTSLASIQTASKTLSSALVDAGEGMSTAEKAFARIGLTSKELRAMKPEDQFLTVAKALSGVSDQATLSATAQDLFGRSATDLLPLLSEGADGLEQMMLRARELGIVFDEEAAAKADKFDDALNDLNKSIEGLKIEAGGVLSDVLQPMIDSLAGLFIGVRELAEENPALANTLSKVGIEAAVMLTTFGGIVLMLPQLIAGMKALGLASMTMGGYISAALAGLGMIAYGVMSIMGTNAHNKELESLRGDRADLWGNGVMSTDAAKELIANYQAEIDMLESIRAAGGELSEGADDYINQQKEIVSGLEEQLNNQLAIAQSQDAAAKAKQQEVDLAKELLELTIKQSEAYYQSVVGEVRGNYPMEGITDPALRASALSEAQGWEQMAAEAAAAGRTQESIFAGLQAANLYDRLRRGETVILQVDGQVLGSVAMNRGGQSYIENEHYSGAY